MHPEAENFQRFQTKVSSLDFRFPHITLSHSGCMPYSQKSVCQLSFGWLCSSSSSGSSVPLMQVRPVCLLEDSFSTQMSTTKTKLSNHLEAKGGYCSKVTQTFSGTLLDFLIVSQYWLFIYLIYQSTAWNSKNNMHHINTMPELKGQCRDSPLKHGQHKW